MDQIDARVVALQVIEAHRKCQNAYDCLLLPRTASFLDVRAAYKRLLFLHPDKNPTVDVAQEAFKIVRAAFDEIKANSQQAREPDLAGGINNSAPVGNKWSAYTSAQAAEQVIQVDIPSAAAQPPPAPPQQQQQQPTAWSSLPAQQSKWGRPSTDTNRLLKTLEVPTSRLKPASLPQSLDSEPQEHTDHRQPAPSSKVDNILLQPAVDDEQQPEIEDHEDVIKIDCGSFYGGKKRSTASGSSKKEKPKQPLPPPQQQQQQQQHQQKGWKDGGASKWSDVSRHNPLTELLRNPEAAATAMKTTAKDDEKAKLKKRPAGAKTKNKPQKKRQNRTRVVVIASDSDDDFSKRRVAKKEEEKELSSTESGSESAGSEDGEDRDGGNSSDGWDSKEEEFEEEEPVSEAAGEAKSKALINLLLAQQRSQAKHRLQAGAAQRARQRAAFGRGGGRKRKQTRLKLAPITSK
jgi:curved DNA-binding protein CbpA